MATELVAGPEPLRRAYAAARLTGRSAPLDPRFEEPALARARRRLAAWLGLDPPDADEQARRCLLLQRDRRVHEVLALRARPALLRRLVDGVAVDGLDAAASSRSGLLLVSLHYGPYTTLLWLALARAASARLLPPPTFLLDRTLDPCLALPPDRSAQLAESGLFPGSALDLVDAATTPVGAWRRLREALAAGRTVVVFADPLFLPAAAPRALPLPIGARTLRVPRGVDWIARSSGCRVAGVAVAPDGDEHRLTVVPTADARGALAWLGRRVAEQPAPWEGWMRDQANLDAPAE
ncbi:MAG TPA: hypothetical protein VF186_00205 [Gaiellaceae bacterium]